MTKHKLSSDRCKQFRHLLRLHILGLKKNFPGWIFPTHHLVFHIHEFMDLFSGVCHWWLFPFEKLIGKLQRTPTNHKPGERIPNMSCHRTLIYVVQVNLNIRYSTRSTQELSFVSG
ncbi:hypothetical protein EV359DRAFT_35431 [Lentinula novae-zelandiae]|nr:hypothetical protein EV359DRAFT_35431 [Lentinula novae-zelandiae]